MELYEPFCADGWSSDEAEVDGECPECGMPTVGGEAAYGCDWSEITCEVCHHAPCDGSC